MPGPGSNFGPITISTRPQSSPTTPNINDGGMAVCEQNVTLAQNGTTAVSGTLYLPIGSVILDIIEDTTVAWNSGTAVATVGTAAADTSFAPSTSVAAAGRVRPTFTAAELINMGSIASPAAVVATVTPTGATTAGSTNIKVLYAPTVQQFTGNT